MFAAPIHNDLDTRRLPPAAGLAGLALLAVAAVTWATLCPPVLRPHIASAWVERFGAYFIIGVLVTVISPRNWPVAAVFVIALAFGLEMGQIYVPGRDAMTSDALVKAFGGASGVVAACMAVEFRRRALEILGQGAGLRQDRPTADA